jgi:hypothetical protein
LSGGLGGFFVLRDSEVLPTVHWLPEAGQPQVQHKVWPGHCEAEPGADETPLPPVTCSFSHPRTNPASCDQWAVITDTLL